MALKDLWQQQRQQRQRDLATRHQSVRSMLTMSQQKRQQAAAATRDELNLFRASLVKVNQMRSITALDRQAERQAEHQHRGHEVQAFLAETSEQRQVKAQQVAQELAQFVHSLQVSTADFLALTGAERELMAHQLSRELQAFRQALITKVETLRQTLQIDIKTLQTETQLFLYQSQQERLKQQLQLSQELALFIDSLRADVQAHLTTLAATRPDRAIAVAAMLEHSRTDRLAAVATLWERWAEFRTQLQAYRASLSLLVWGDASELPLIAASTPTATPQRVPLASTAPVPAAPAKALPSLVVTVPVLAASSPLKSVAKPPAIAAPAPIAPKLDDFPLNMERLAQVIDAFADASLPPVTSTHPTTNPQTPEADQILQYLSTVAGARLTEIESALGLSRFKTVDALRVLIRAGSITQHDRLYIRQV